MGELFDIFRRINTILIDLCIDIWLYISKRYISQIVHKKEVGSSTMPHKVNPIHFEKAEGNLLIANSLLECFSRNLPVSRLQRDLTDSTICRNIGVALGHTEIAYRSICKGLERIAPNREVIHQELHSNRQILSEGIQTWLRKWGYSQAYDIVKEYTRQTESVEVKWPEFYTILETTYDIHLTPEQQQQLEGLSVETYLGTSDYSNTE